MKKEKWIFEKYICDCALNGIFAAKYRRDDHIKVVIEKLNGKPIASREFESHADYENWLDELVDDGLVYNHARALHSIITSIS